MGDARGAALALMGERLCSAMTGSYFAFEASSFYDAEGPPPHGGHLFVVFKPESLGGDGVLDPFVGSGTVVRVAIRHNRLGVGCDRAYHHISAMRTSRVQRKLKDA